MSNFRKFLFFLLPLLLFSGIYAQRTRAKVQLAKNRARLEGKIQLTHKLLSETAAKKEKSMGELTMIRQQIGLREELINALEEEILELGEEIGALEGQICDTEEQLVSLRRSYGLTAQLTYQSFHDENFWLSVLSADNLSDAYYRVVYFQQFSRYHKQQIEALNKTQQLLIDKTKDLNLAVADKTQLIDEKKQEVLNLSESKNNQSILLTELKGKEQIYREDLQVEKSQLRRIIESMDVDTDDPVPPAINPKTPTKPTRPTLPTDKPATSTEIATANKNNSANAPADAAGKFFEKQKGRLASPIVGGRGVVIGKFGATQDEYGNPVNNDGIYIRTPQGQEVKSVYDGKVTAVTKVPLSGTMVIIAHGKYRSVYANLRESNVAQGEYVKANQVIGVVRTDPRTDEAVLNFMIHKAPSSYLNPQAWLRDE